MTRKMSIDELKQEPEERYPGESWDAYGERQGLTESENLTMQLIDAVQKDNTIAIKELLDLKVDVNARAPSRLSSYLRMTALHHVGSLEALDLLVNTGQLDLDVQAEDGYTLLMDLAQGDQGASDIMARLIKLGADLQKRNNRGQTAEDIAKANGKLAIAEVLAASARKKALLYFSRVEEALFTWFAQPSEGKAESTLKTGDNSFSKS